MNGIWALAARRLIGLALTLLAVSFLVFALTSVLPGDQAAIMLGTSATPETLAALRAELGLDQPMLWRYAAWAGKAVTGDLGTSATYGIPASRLILERLAVTGPLAALALALALCLALPLAMRGARGDRGAELAGTLVAQTGIALPNFFIGLILILAFGGILPVGGFAGWSAIGPAILSLILPAVALALPQAAVLLRQARAALKVAWHADFVRTARAKGLGEPAIMRRHVLRHAAGPILALIGLQLSYLVAGAVLVENVFVLPGLGRLAVQALQQRDIVVLQACVLFFVVLVILVNALIDLVILALDPRQRA